MTHVPHTSSSSPSPEGGCSAGVALWRTARLFVVVTLVWLILAAFLPNFHLAGAPLGERLVFVAVVLALLGSILAAQVAMLRSWFGSLESRQPAHAARIGMLRWAIFILVASGVVAGLAVLWYANAAWMPHVHDAVHGHPGQSAGSAWK